MNIVRHEVSWYVEKIKKGEPFSIGMYGDGEWQCIFNKAFNDGFRENCEGTTYTKELSESMLGSLKFNEPNFYFATSGMLWDGDFKRYGKLIDKLTNIEFHEKGVWNEAMYKCELYEFIKEARNHNVCIVGNKNLKKLTFLKYKKFIEVGYPNCYGEMDRAIRECLDYGSPGIYIFACGIPATLFVQKLHNKIKDSWFLDTGSIWDTFVGIGGQRATRRELYQNPEQWKEWRDNTLKDIYWSIKELPMINWYGMGSKEIYQQLN